MNVLVQFLKINSFQFNIHKAAYNRVDCPADLSRQGKPLTPPYVRVSYTAVRKLMGYFSVHFQH